MANTYDQILGFEAQSFSAATANGGAAGSSSTTGSPTIDTSLKRTGAASAQVSKVAASSPVYHQLVFASAITGQVWRLYVYFTTLPDTNTERIMDALSASSSRGFVNITTAGVVSISTGGTPQTGPTLVTGHWYRFDVKLDVSANPWRIDCQVTDDTGVTTVITQATNAVAASTFDRFRTGTTGVLNTVKFNWDDYAWGSNLADYPYGAGHVELIQIDACGTHSAQTAGDFKNDAGTNVTVGETTSFSKLNEAVADTTSWVREVVAQTGEYLQYSLADPASSPKVPRAVQPIAVWTASATTGNNSTTRLNDGGSTLNVFSGGQTATGVNYHTIAAQTTKPSGGAWTDAAIKGLLIEHGFSSLVTSFIRLTDVFVEVEYQDAITSNNSESGSVTPAGVLTREADRILGGTVTPAGTISRSQSESEAGTITPAGTLRNQPSNYPTGTITPHGALSIVVTRAGFTGTLTPAGVVHKEVDTVPMTGSITPAGDLSNRASTDLGGTITPAGALSHFIIGKLLGGTLTPAGAIAVSVTRGALAGTMTPAGSLAKEIDLAMAGLVTPSGVVSRTFTFSFAGTLTPTGALAILFAEAFTGTLSPVGLLSVLAAPLGGLHGFLTPRGGSPYYNHAGGLVDAYGTIVKDIEKHMAGRCTPLVIGRPPGGGGTGGSGQTGPGGSGPGDGTGGTGGTGGGGTTLTDCPCTINLTIGGGLTITVGTIVTTPGTRPRNLLGCGTYQVFLMTRGGRQIVVTIPWTALQWSRVLSDTSTASVTVQGVSGVSPECAQGLAGIRPRKYELGIYRSSYLVWAGPVSTPLKVVGDTLTITASDLSSWFDRRRIRRDIAMTADLSEILTAYVDAAMESDPSPQLLLQGGESGIIGQRSVLAAQHALAGPLIRELGNGGVPWTVDRRTLRYGLLVTPPDPIALLIDDSYVDQPDVEIADLGANDLIVAGQGTGEAGDTIYGYARDAASQAEYGLLDAVYRESLILDDASAQARADDDLALVRIPPTVVNGGTLQPFAPVLIEQLVPGVQIDNRLLTSLFPVAGPFQLTKLDVTAGNDGSEQVAVTFQPVASPA